MREVMEPVTITTEFARQVVVEESFLRVRDLSNPSRHIYTRLYANHHRELAQAHHLAAGEGHVGWMVARPEVVGGGAFFALDEELEATEAADRYRASLYPLYRGPVEYDRTGPKQCEWRKVEGPDPERWGRCLRNASHIVDEEADDEGGGLVAHVYLAGDGMKVHGVTSTAGDGERVLQAITAAIRDRAEREGR